MFEVIAHPELVARWERVTAGEDIDWNEVLEGYRSTVDWPGCAYWRELAAAYPDAKVILTREHGQIEETYAAMLVAIEA